MTVNEKIFELLKTHNMRPSKLADTLGISRNTAYNWREDRGTKPQLGSIEKIAEYFNVSIDKLLDDKCGMEELLKKEPEDIKAIIIKQKPVDEDELVIHKSDFINIDEVLELYQKMDRGDAYRVLAFMYDIVDKNSEKKQYERKPIATNSAYCDRLNLFSRNRIEE